MQARDASILHSLCLVLGGITTLLVACSQTSPRTFQSHDHSTLPRSVQVEGDWDDVPAVVAGIIPRVELVADPPTVNDDQMYRCRVHSPRFGPGWIQFDRLDDSFIRIDVRIGRFEHPPEEHWIEQALADRFSQIRGDTAAPIRIPPRRH